MGRSLKQGEVAGIGTQESDGRLEELGGLHISFYQKGGRRWAGSSRHRAQYLRGTGTDAYNPAGSNIITFRDMIVV